MPQYNFGSGEVFAIPGAAAPDQTIMRVATLQEAQVDISTSIKLLNGSRQFAEEAANAEGKLTGKIKFGRFDGRLLSSVLPGAVKTPGAPIEVSEAGTVAAGAVTVAGSATLADDLGVYAADGTPYSKIIPASFTASIATTVLTVSAISAGSLGPGQIVAGSGVTAGTTILAQLTGTPGGVGTYSLSVSQTVASEAMTTTAGLLQYSGPSAGVYTFATGSNGLALTFKYSKTQTTGSTIAVPNAPMGVATKYLFDLFNYAPGNGSKTFGIKIYAGVFTKLALPFKNTDFTMLDMEIEGLDNGSGKVYDLYVND